MGKAPSRNHPWNQKTEDQRKVMLGVRFGCMQRKIYLLIRVGTCREFLVAAACININRKQNQLPTEGYLHFED